MIEPKLKLPANLHRRPRVKSKPRQPPNRKDPGKSVLQLLLKTHSIPQVAEKYSVKTVTVQRWVAEHQLVGIRSQIAHPNKGTHQTDDRQVSAETKDCELAAQWARRPLSKAQGINGWRFTMTWGQNHELA